MMLVYICFARAVMNDNTFFAWKIIMTYFTETIDKVVKKTLCDNKNQSQESTVRQ
jgi:hypothetical protein